MKNAYLVYFMNFNTGKGGYIYTNNKEQDISIAYNTIEEARLNTPTNYIITELAI